MSFASKLATATWFAGRPSFWRHAMALGWRAVSRHPHEDTREEATAWAKKRTCSAKEALASIGLEPGPAGLPQEVLEEGRALAAASRSTMGGPGDLDLLYRAILVLEAKRVVETGVAYGWSSLSALSALEQTGGRLASVDMPYPKMGNESDVGIVVPQRLRDRWVLIREPDRNGIGKALSALGGALDLAHYDSDKTYAGRMFALPRLWRALRPGGLLIVDDIQDNLGFRDFAFDCEAEPQVCESDGKYVGLLRKPD